MWIQCFIRNPLTLGQLVPAVVLLHFVNHRASALASDLVVQLITAAPWTSLTRSLTTMFLKRRANRLLSSFRHSTSHWGVFFNYWSKRVGEGPWVCGRGFKLKLRCICFVMVKRCSSVIAGPWQPFVFSYQLHLTNTNSFAYPSKHSFYAWQQIHCSFFQMPNVFRATVQLKAREKKKKTLRP